MAKTKINKSGWANTPNVYYVGAMRTTDSRSNEVESENAQWVAARAEFRTKFRALDDAYQKSLVSMSTQIIAEKDEERDVWGQVLEPLAALLNADYKKIEEQMAQSRKLPTVLVKSEVVGNHHYSVPEYAKWADIVEANDKAFAIDASTDNIVSLAPKAKKVGGLFLAFGSVAVKPTDAVDAKKEYALVEIGGGSDVTPVTPE